MADLRNSAAVAPTRPRAQKPMSATQRKSLAMLQIVNALEATDQTAVITAALEAVSERLAWDTELQRSLHQKYEELHLLGGGKKARVDLGPASQMRNPPSLGTFNPLAKVNPFDLAEYYGHDQLRNVVSRASRDLLREMVGVVLVKVPGAKPPNRNRNTDMVDFIVEQVVGPEY